MSQFQYKTQRFQQDAVSAVADMFQGVDIGHFQRPEALRFAPENDRERPFDLLRRHFIAVLQDNLEKIQKRNQIQPVPFDSGGDYLVLDTQMETGTGKTFTFINAIFELHKRYGLTHFIIIVPSIAIKEGIKKSFDTTRSYFERLYQGRIQVYEMGAAKGKKGRKSPPAGVMSFIYSQHPTALIMTNHAFNSATNVINQKLEGFYADSADTPMEAIGAKAPVLIIDEPQRVEGQKTIEKIKDFNPLFVLRYSATFREGQIKNPLYILDSYDAFDKKLVKGIGVTDYQIGRADAAFLGVRRLSGAMAGSGSAGSRAMVELEAAGADGETHYIRTGVEREGSSGRLFEITGNRAYRDLRVARIDLREKTVEFSDGRIKRILKLGEYSGRELENDKIITEVMLRDTIDKHLRKERQLFPRNIKCLSLIFIDRVKDYRDYESDDGKGYLQELFERCYEECRKSLIDSEELTADYRAQLEQWAPAMAHGGYFCGDAKRNQKIDEGASTKNDNTARALQQEISELILRDKEKILRPTNQLRFIFAHSALREGWDNPNVFQICKLRTSYSETGIVQEVGRGLRICVNEELARQDEDTVGGEFSTLNRLDVFTLGNGDFIGRLQQELDERRSRAKAEPAQILPEKLCELYADISVMQGYEIYKQLHEAGCIDENGYLLTLQGIKEVLVAAGLEASKLIKELPSRLRNRPKAADNRRQEDGEREYRVNPKRYQEFKDLWMLLHQKVIYEVKYSEDFEKRAAQKIDAIEGIVPLYITRQMGRMDTRGGEFTQEGAQRTTDDRQQLASNMPTRELLRQLAEKTDLPRNSIIRILGKVGGSQYQAMQKNPFLAIERAAGAINKAIYESIVDNIRYHKVDGLRQSQTRIELTDKTFSATRYLRLNDLEKYSHSHNKNSLWEKIAPYDSEVPEKEISEKSLGAESITVFAKIPRAVNIPTPLHDKGINPDFAFILEKEEEGKQFYFVAEAKPSTDTDDLRGEEERRIKFTEKYFEGIDPTNMHNIRFKVVSNYDQILQWFQEAEKEAEKKEEEP